MDLAFGDDDTRTMRVLVNDEEQYSLWLAFKPNPLGWRDAGFEGSKAECLEFVESVWTDMTPKSLRESVQGAVPGQPE